MAPYSKAIAAFVSTFLSALAMAAPGGITRDEWLPAVLSAAAVAAGVYFAPKNADA